MEITKYLVSKGADVNASNKKTPLILAAYAGKAELVRFLITVGADMNRQDESEWTGLHFASQEGHLETVRVLLHAGANTTLRNSEGKTAEDVAEANINFREILSSKSSFNQPIINHQLISKIKEESAFSIPPIDSSIDFERIFENFKENLLQEFEQRDYDIISKVKYIEEKCKRERVSFEGSEGVHHLRSIEEVENAMKTNKEKYEKMKNSYKSTKKRLEEKLTQLGGKMEELLCSICYEMKKDTVLNCGHTFCNPCAQKFITCPSCRKHITSRMKIYL